MRLGGYDALAALKRRDEDACARERDETERRVAALEASRAERRDLGAETVDERVGALELQVAALRRELADLKERVS